VCVFGEFRSLCLFGGEETLLVLGELKEPPRRFAVRLDHNTIPQLY
jgi:hypothetical protein